MALKISDPFLIAHENSQTIITKLKKIYMKRTTEYWRLTWWFTGAITDTNHKNKVNPKKKLCIFEAFFHWQEISYNLIEQNNTRTKFRPPLIVLDMVLAYILWLYMLHNAIPFKFLISLHNTWHVCWDYHINKNSNILYTCTFLRWFIIECFLMSFNNCIL